MDVPHRLQELSRERAYLLLGSPPAGIHLVLEAHAVDELLHKHELRLRPFSRREGIDVRRDPGMPEAFQHSRFPLEKLQALPVGERAHGEKLHDNGASRLPVLCAPGDRKCARRDLAFQDISGADDVSRLHREGFSRGPLRESRKAALNLHAAALGVI